MYVLIRNNIGTYLKIIRQKLSKSLLEAIVSTESAFNNNIITKSATELSEVSTRESIKRDF